MPKGADWNLVIQTQIAVKWLEESMNSSNPYVKKEVEEYRKKRENCGLLNPGVLIAYAFMVFVYPKETEQPEIKKLKTDYSKFQVTKGSFEFRRIRNAIAHGRFSVSHDDGIITFWDSRLDEEKKIDIDFEASISLWDFGSFVDSYCSELKALHFAKKRKPSGRAS